MILDQSARLRSLPAQLYLQLVCQTVLFHRIIDRGSLYFVQRYPVSLGSFRWRIDRKNRTPTDYEGSFKDLLPGLLQTKSLTEPMIRLVGANYSYFKRFENPLGEMPTYLPSEFGIGRGDGFDIGKLVREDFQLVDSAASAGVQVADLLAAGLRRLLRGGFAASEQVTGALGRILVSPMHGEHAVRLVTLDEECIVSWETSKVIRRLDRYAKHIIKNVERR